MLPGLGHESIMILSERNILPLQGEFENWIYQANEQNSHSQAASPTLPGLLAYFKKTYQKYNESAALYKNNIAIKPVDVPSRGRDPQPSPPSPRLSTSR
jgi:hypothetical protein